MKYLKSFNESVRDLMKPKSIEDIKKSLANLPPDEQYYNSKYNKYFYKNIYTEEELNEILNRLTPEKKLNIGSSEGILWLVKKSIEEGVDSKYYHSALSVASHNNQIGIIKYLLEIGIGDHPSVDLGRCKDMGLENLSLDACNIITDYIKNNKLEESVRDLMKPKSIEDIKSMLEGKPYLYIINTTF